MKIEICYKYSVVSPSYLNLLALKRNMHAAIITFSCLSLFCFINFGIDHGFSKQISFCTLCLKSLKQTIKKELIRFSHSLIHMHRLLMIVYKKTEEWYNEWQNECYNEWQRMTTSGTTSDNESQRVTASGTTNDSEWQRVVQRLTAKVSRRFQTYINHRVLFHHFLRRFPQ